MAMIAAAVLAGGPAGTRALADQSAAGPAAGFDKYLVMKDQANVPNVEFTYTIGHDPSLAHPAEGDHPQVFEGIGSPSIGSAVFSPSDSTWTSVQANGATASAQTKQLPQQDELTLEEGEKYAKKTVMADLSGITFTEPGIYRYAIREEVPSAQRGFFMRDPEESENVLYLDVYINSDETGQLSASGCVLHRNNEVSEGMEQDTQYDGGFGTEGFQVKPSGFVNEYRTSDLELAKKVTGNQGDRSRYFAFTVSITGVSAGTVFTVDLSAADTAAQVDGQKVSNPSSLTADSNGSVTAVFYLKHGQSASILGLPYEAVTQVTEEIEESEGYKVSYEILEGESLEKLEENGQGSTQGCATGAIETGSTSRQILYTNYRNGIIPTGIFLETGPVVMMILAAAAALIVLGYFSRKRRA